MKITKARLAGATVLTAVAAAGVVGAPTSSAQKYQTPKPKPVTIKAVTKGKTPKFKGPSKVAKGAKLVVLNDSDPRKIGPHTWSLVDPSLLPKSKAEGKACANLEEGTACGLIARAHKVNPKTFKIGKPDVDAGKKGWDKAFGKEGDTFYSETEGESETRKVTAKAGTKLTFFCAVHPNMVKNVKVTG